MERGSDERGKEPCYGLNVSTPKMSYTEALISNLMVSRGGLWDVITVRLSHKGLESPTQWTWIWANSGKQWRRGKPGVLQSTGSQRVRHDLELQRPKEKETHNLSLCHFKDTARRQPSAHQKQGSLNPTMLTPWCKLRTSHLTTVRNQQFCWGHPAQVLCFIAAQVDQPTLAVYDTGPRDQE